jgi:hypothetical protein
MERYHERLMLGRCEAEMWAELAQGYVQFLAFILEMLNFSHRSVLIFSISCPFQDVIFTSK